MVLYILTSYRVLVIQTYLITIDLSMLADPSQLYKIFLVFVHIKWHTTKTYPVKLRQAKSCQNKKLISYQGIQKNEENIREFLLFSYSMLLQIKMKWKICDESGAQRKCNFFFWYLCYSLSIEYCDSVKEQLSNPYSSIFG